MRSAAFTVAVFGHLRLPSQAVIFIGPTVTTAHRLPNISADSGRNLAKTEALSVVAGPLGEVTELTTPTEVASRVAVELSLTFPVRLLLSAGSDPETVVAIGHPIAPTDRIEDLGTVLVLSDTDPFKVGGVALTLGEVAELTTHTEETTETATDAIVLALTCVVELDTGAEPLAVVAIRHTITAADRVQDPITRRGDLHADTWEVCTVARIEDGDVTEEVAFAHVTEEAATTVRGIFALARVQETHTRRSALTVVRVGLVVAAADGVDLSATGCRSLIAKTLTAGLTVALAEGPLTTYFVVSAGLRLRLTRTYGRDVDARRLGKTSVVVGDIITSADGVCLLRAHLGLLGANTLSCTDLETEITELSVLTVAVLGTAHRIRVGLGLRLSVGLGLWLSVGLGLWLSVGLGLRLRVGLGFWLGIRLRFGLGLWLRFGLGVRFCRLIVLRRIFIPTGIEPCSKGGQEQHEKKSMPEFHFFPQSESRSSIAS
jgi:hypothetical protein